MVSEKIIVILLIAAILLSVVSIAVTLTTINVRSVPVIQIQQPGKTDDIQQGQVGIIISPPAVATQ